MAWHKNSDSSSARSNNGINGIIEYKGQGMKTYIFQVELSQDEDGRWNAVAPALPACYTWGNSKEDALAHIQDAVRCCVEDMLAHGETLPPGVVVVDSPVATVTL